MPTAREWFTEFTENNYSSSGRVWVQFWGAQIQVSFDKNVSDDWSPINAAPSDCQFEILDAVINYTGDFTNTLERALFDYYRDSVYDSMAIYDHLGTDVTDRYAPKLNSPAEIWKLIRDPYLAIPYAKAQAHNVAFVVMMGCTWDASHGVCAVVRDWVIAADEVGQIGNFYDVFNKR